MGTFHTYTEYWCFNCYIVQCTLQCCFSSLLYKASNCTANVKWQAFFTVQGSGQWIIHLMLEACQRDLFTAAYIEHTVQWCRRRTHSPSIISINNATMVARSVYLFSHARRLFRIYRLLYIIYGLIYEEIHILLYGSVKVTPVMNHL